MPVEMDASDESMEMVYAVRLGSVFSATIWGRPRLSVRDERMGAQMSPLTRPGGWGARIVSLLTKVKGLPKGERERDYTLCAGS